MCAIGEALNAEIATIIWRLEPVVDLRECGDIRAWELLTRASFTSPEAWVAMYAMLPEVVRSMRECHGIKEPLSVNLNTKQILDPEIIRHVTRLDGKRTSIEWTEYRESGDDDKRRAGEQLVRLRERYGFKIWVDDAGSGEDAMGRIGITQPDGIKIDGQLFQSVYEGKVSQGVVRLLLSAAIEFHAQTIIEWIETPSHRQFAARCGADMGQGFLWLPRRFAVHRASGHLVEI